MDKVFLDYDRPLWMSTKNSIKYSWSPEQLDERQGWIKGISAIEEVEGSDHVLCAYVTGQEASLMEHASDEEVAGGVTKVLRKETENEKFPYPTGVSRSKWASDPYFCGAYSYLGSESKAAHQCDLSCPVPGTCDPIPPILLFAGWLQIGSHALSTFMI